jgi:predicted permease
MRRLRAWLVRAFAAFSGSAGEREISSELESHLQMHIAENVRRGMSPQQARRDALLRLGGVEQTKQLYRERRGIPFLEIFLQDVRFGARMLGKNFGFTLVAVLTLALGIGGNTAVFSVMNAVLLRNLPLPNPEQLVYLRIPDGRPEGTSSTGDSETSFTLPMFQQLRNEHLVFSDLMAYVPLSVGKVAIRIGDEPEEAQGDMVSGNFFSGLRVRFALGRGFTLDEEISHAPVAVLSHSFWTARFGRDSSVLGRVFYIKGVPVTVVGVTSDGFFGIEPGVSTDFWIPLQDRPELNAWGEPASLNTIYHTPTWWCLQLIGRLQPGITQGQAVTTLTPTFQSAAFIGLGTPDPKVQKPVLALEPAKGIEGARDDYERPIRILMAMVGFVLAIACANVAMLLVARNTARANEFSVRIALGAGRNRLLRQLLTESLLLVSAGALLGWFFAVAASRALAVWSDIEVPFTPDRNVLLFTLGISIACAFVFALAPLRSALRVPVGLAVRTSRSTAHRDRQTSRTGRIVVAAQMALCLMLLVGASLLLRCLRNYEILPLGLRTDGLLVFGADSLSAHSDEERARFYENLLQRMRTIPGVESATLVEHRLGSGWASNGVWPIDGVLPQGPFSETGSRSNDVGPGYLHTLGIPILRGRDIADSDRRGSPKVAVVDQTFADRFFPKTDPLGHTIGDTRGENRHTIVGVAADSKYTSVAEKLRPVIYFPYSQRPFVSDMQVELRTLGDPEALIPSIRAVLREIDPNLPMQKPMTQRAQFDESFSQARLFARLSLFFGAVAVLLVATGLYGTLAYRVSRRTPEIGVRMALGAQRRQVLSLVLGETVWISLAGALLGVPLAFACAQLMRSMLFGVTPGDTFSFLAALLGVALVALLASFLPARRAMGVDPIVALRYE